MQQGGIFRQPRFGWQQAIHQVIGHGAISRMQPSSFQSYLQQNLPDIQQHDDAQDIWFKGPGHFIDLGDKNNADPNIPIQALTGQHLLSAFAPARKQALQNIPLEEPHLPQGPSAYQSILSAFAGVQNSLAYCVQQPFQNNPQLLLQLNQQIGQLAHYVGDVLMPLHTTPFSDWYLGQGSQKTMHHFIEGEVLTLADAPVIAAQSATLPPLNLTLQNLKPFLLESIRQSHLKMFDIIGMHQQAEANSQNPNGVENALRLQLRPLMINQVAQAQQALAGLLELAWKSATGQV